MNKELLQPVDKTNPIVFLDVNIGQEFGEFVFFARKYLNFLLEIFSRPHNH